MIRIVAFPLALVIVFANSGSQTEAQASRGTWPQWGAARNFHIDSVQIARSWPQPGPRQIWRHPLGEGYSSILVDGDALVTMYRRNDDEVVVAMDAETGARRGEHAYRAPLLHDAQMVDAGGTLIIVDENGEIALASPTRDGLHVHARKELLTANSWTPPTVVGSTVYVRDRKDILALDLRP